MCILMKNIKNVIEIFLKMKCKTSFAKLVSKSFRIGVSLRTLSVMSLLEKLHQEDRHEGGVLFLSNSKEKLTFLLYLVDYKSLTSQHNEILPTEYYHP